MPLAGRCVWAMDSMSVANTTLQTIWHAIRAALCGSVDDHTNVSLNNVTLANNLAASVNGVDGLGGGIMMASGTLSVNNATIANNQAGFMGGAIYGGGANVVLRNTIIASNTVEQSVEHQSAMSAH